MCIRDRDGILRVTAQACFEQDSQSKTQRLTNFCFERRNWLKEAWRTVVFPDESRFDLFPRRKTIVRCIKTKQFCQHVQQGGDEVMVWECITSEGPGQLPAN